MKIITCNFQGRKHSERNEPCEDSVYYLKGSEVTTVAVADGAGSKKYEHAKDGADAVTKAVCNFFDAKFDDFFESSNELELRSVIQTICHKALKERAKELELDSIETMASTLLAVSIKGNKLISVQIGDGLIGRLFHDELETVTMPQNGEYASSTYFINDAEAFKMVQVRKMFLTGTTHLFLMSDGVADCMFNDFNGEFNESLKKLLETADEPAGEKKVRKVVKEFIVDADPMSDDCTMAVVCFNEQKVAIETETLMPEPVVPEVQADAVLQSYMTTQSVAPAIDTDVSDIEQNRAFGEKKKFATWKLIAIIVAAVIIITGVVVGVVLGIKGSNDKNNDKNGEKGGNGKESTSQMLTVEADKDTNNEGVLGEGFQEGVDGAATGAAGTEPANNVDTEEYGENSTVVDQTTPQN